MNPKVDDFLDKADNWQFEMRQLRQIILECGLDEELKWHQPCYTFKGKNIAIIGALKANCLLGFFKGILLSDSEKLLVSPGENSQSVMQLKFNSLASITLIEKTIKAYVFEAVEIEKAGLQIEKQKSAELEYPLELQTIFLSKPTLKQAFENLTAGRQRGYMIFFNGAKQSATRVTRIEKHEQRILMGKGMNDCICGASKRMPNCDGSHKYL